MATPAWLLALLLTSVYCVPLDVNEECGYKNCARTDAHVLNVHIVAHSHDDVGWLKTVDQYYYGSKNSIQKAGVQYILDSVIKELWEDAARKFIYVETAFFWKWWVQQAESVQSQVHTLVREGRLVFVGGAWSMNDEAATHYQSTIDQFTWGLSKLNATFGPCALPRVGWQIDPFGHSREFASSLAGMGYDGLFLGRIDFQDKRRRLATKTMEMLWRGDDDLGASSDIFTGVLYNTYSPPPGFCFDVLCNDEPIIDDVHSPMYNVDNKVDLFLDYVKTASRHYASNNLLVTMGGDFTYQDANMWYTNLDKLIQYTNLKAAKDRLDVQVFYSTPNCYLRAVKRANPTLPIKQDDFFPYASDAHSYWSGYFTSRPTTKYFERLGNDYLQTAKQLQVLAALRPDNQFMVNSLKSAMGVMQHHDAITGTEKQHVAHDYERILDGAIDDSLVVPRQAFTKVLQGRADVEPLFSFDRCRLNESSCFTSEHADRFVVTLYNPVAWPVNEAVRVPVASGAYEVYAPNGDKIASQLIDIPQPVIDIPTRVSTATHEVVFIAYLKALKYKSFYVQKLTQTESGSTETKPDKTETEQITNHGVKSKREGTRTKRDVSIIKPIYKNQRILETYDVDGYWKQAKEKTYIEIKNILDELQRSENDKDIKIPDEPIKFEGIVAQPIDLDILRDKDQDNIDVTELERLIQQSKEKIVTPLRPQEAVVYRRLGEEEMRMLSDEPRVVDTLEDHYVLANEFITLQVDNRSGEIKRASFRGGAPLDLRIGFGYYPGEVGDNNVAANRSSGAYILRTKTDQAIPLTSLDSNTIYGPVVNEVRTTWTDNVHSVARLYTGLKYIEIEWLVGPIDITDNIGKEYIIKYLTNMVNNGEFYTDSNGRQSLKRKLNERPQWNLTLAEHVGGNYYPVTNEIYIQDANDKFAVLTDRSQGGTSLAEGEVELMLHRRLLHDDAFGVGEALNETGNGTGLVVRGTHRLMIADVKSNEVKKNVLEMHLRPLVFVSDATKFTVQEWLKMKNCYSWLKAPLPEGLHLLTLEPWGEKLLLRLENYLSKSDKSTLEVDITNILNNITVTSIKETKLSANAGGDEWTWNKEEEFSASFNEEYGSFGEKRNAVEDIRDVDDSFTVKIRAKEIKTYIVEYARVRFE